MSTAAGVLAALGLALAQPSPAVAPSTGAAAGVPLPRLPEAPGARWACDPEHERWRAADLELAKADLPKGLKGAGADLPQLEAALAHAPAEPVGGFAVCDGRTIAFDAPTSLALLLAAANRHEQLSVDRRPMPYAQIALLVGSLHNEAGRFDQALRALDRGLRVDPSDPHLVGEKGFTLIHMGRSGEAAEVCAQGIAAAHGAGDKVLIARLHRTRGYALGEMGRYDDAIAEYRTSQALDPAETASANEITYLQGRKAGRGVSAVRSSTTDQLRKPPS